MAPSKSLISLTTLMILFPLYFVIKISRFSKHSLWIILLLSILIPIGLRWLNNKYSY